MGWRGLMGGRWRDRPRSHFVVITVWYQCLGVESLSPPETHTHTHTFFSFTILHSWASKSPEASGTGPLRLVKWRRDACPDHRGGLGGQKEALGEGRGGGGGGWREAKKRQRGTKIKSESLENWEVEAAAVPFRRRSIMAKLQKKAARSLESCTESGWGGRGGASSSILIPPSSPFSPPPPLSRSELQVEKAAQRGRRIGGVCRVPNRQVFFSRNPHAAALCVAA